MAEQVFEAREEKLPEVTAFVAGQLETWNCPMRTQIQLEVATEELFVNIADYAYPKENYEKPGEVLIRVELLTDRTIQITFFDDGIMYDPLKRPDPDITKPIEEREIGGLGIYMVKKSMDGMDYRYENGQNILTIRKKLEGIPNTGR